MGRLGEKSVGKGAPQLVQVSDSIFIVQILECEIPDSGVIFILP
jgi:hypothetical protein